MSGSGGVAGAARTITPQGTRQGAFSTASASAFTRGSAAATPSGTGILGRGTLSPGGTAVTAGQGTSRGVLTPAGTFGRTAPSLAAASGSASAARFGSASQSISSAQASTVPSIGAARAVSTSGYYGYRPWGSGCHGYPYYGYGYPYYPYYGAYGFYGYPFGFSFSFSFGYPYYPYYCYPRFYPRSSFYIGYPYYGYYYSYPYPYLSYYDDYGCPYYDGYYVRFGYYRSSYYGTCSGYGSHAYSGHHCHTYDCSTHGHHYYHVRDCAECYPSGTHVDVEVPADAAAGAPAVESVPLAPEGEAAAADLVAEAAVLDPQERFFASLKPAQLSFVFGLGHLKAGKYDEATEALYNASIEDPESKLVKVFLGISLLSLGEHGYAAEYLRLGLEEWEAFPGYEWRLQDLYGRPGDFDAQLALLEESARVNPSRTDAALVLGFLAMHSGDLAKAGDAFDSVRSLSDDAVEQTIARRYIAEIEVRTGAFPRPAGETAPPAEEDVGVQAFLATLAPADVPNLPIR